jgi:hypothetical protein
MLGRLPCVGGWIEEALEVRRVVVQTGHQMTRQLYQLEIISRKDLTLWSPDWAGSRSKGFPRGYPKGATEMPHVASLFSPENFSIRQQRLFRARSPKFKMPVGASLALY